jgi:hypothetical protein
MKIKYTNIYHENMRIVRIFKTNIQDIYVEVFNKDRIVLSGTIATKLRLIWK